MYADDIAALKLGDDESLIKLEERVNNISEGSRDELDMDVNAQGEDCGAGAASETQDARRIHIA